MSKRMSESMELDDEARRWREELRAFLESRREGDPLPDSGQLDALRDEQRRVTGGSLIQFLQFIQEEQAFEAFPILEERPISERIFVFATDGTGVVAARDIIDFESDRAVVVTKEEWRAWTEDPECDSDEAFERHYECWSVWHQNLKAHWQGGEADDRDDLWVHEEGFALADRTGRGASHLWVWDGEQLQLREEEIDGWSSSPPRE